MSFGGSAQSKLESPRVENRGPARLEPFHRRLVTHPKSSPPCVRRLHDLICPKRPLPSPPRSRCFPSSQVDSTHTMSTSNAPQLEPPFTFNYSIDNEMLSVVLTKEVYLIPFQKARGAFDGIRRRMIQTNSFRTVPFPRHDPAASSSAPTTLQLLKHYQYLIVNHPSREVPPAQEPFPQAQFRKRSRLLDQIFSKIIGTVYVRGVGRPPRKYNFDGRLDLMLLEQVLQRKAHLRPRSQLNPTFSSIRQGIIVNYGFTSGHTVPAPTNVVEGAPTASQLIVRYQYLILSHVSSSSNEESGQPHTSEAARKRSHLLDIIVRDIVTQALSGAEILRKSRRSSLEAFDNDGELSAPRPKRRKSYPSVGIPIAERSPRAKRTPGADPFESQPTRARELNEEVQNAITEIEKEKEPRTLPQAEPEDEVMWRRRMEERRIALDEDRQKKSWKLAALQEQRMKIEQQRMKLQEKTFEMMQEEHKVFIGTLSGLATTFSKVAEKLGFAAAKADSNNKDPVESDTMPQGCDPVTVIADLDGEDPVTIDETPTNIAPTSKEVPPKIERQQARKTLAVKAKQFAMYEGPREGQTVVGSSLAAEIESSMQNGSSEGVPEENKLPGSKTVGRAKELMRNAAPRQPAVGKKATARTTRGTHLSNQ
ncbi:hypothetical protein FGB62_2g18 [Gracilaria domingensis]|nr:hypothetical protein FGB62_2g18 [Gracilaria domingensis]